MDLGHRIVAMVGALPKRVLCMTCGSEHNYRAEKNVSSPVPKEPKADGKVKAPKAPKAAGSGGSGRSTRTREEWEKRVRSGAPLRRYTIVDTYELDQLITHKKFGDGYVCGLGDGKVTIMFIDGERTLIQGASA
ncbi:MAG TPA: hypothetical protein VN764_11295 [Polyangiaceae bacterium]|nr:hypothetical protein [Polyangiaceae bacterium]